jgi:alpha-L-fucosidase 2
MTLWGAHGEKVVADGRAAVFSGTLPNGLTYAARAEILPGTERTRTVVVLRAATARPLASTPRYEPFDALLARHVADYRRYYDRMTFDLGTGDRTLPTRERVRRVRRGGTDAPLLALLFNFGRYLLISSSRPGTLPANLQGIWNNSNTPPWHSDYHTDINIQMNYWGADSANLSDCFTPLSDWMIRTLPTAEAGTRAAFPRSKGFAYRMSANAVGGGGWRWNFAGAPWLAAQCYDHWLFTRDNRYLRDVCWPLMKGAAEFMMSTQLKERADGTVVVVNGWSPEHGPREDGIAHDQQIMRELFRSILSAADTLGIDDAFTREVARLEPKLLKDKIGRWGQLQEWERDRDKKGDTHRHTSHLYAVYPGSTISRKATPELAKAAKVALAGRTTTGDSRRSWTWPWRAALWARLGEGDKAGEMLESLLKYNTLDNMFATHPPFQIDGNLGMVAAVCEILLEKSIPADWKGGSVKGLRTREGKTINFCW